MLQQLYYNINRKSIERSKKHGKCQYKRKTTVSDILNRYPEAAEVFYGIGMHRFGWPASREIV